MSAHEYDSGAKGHKRYYEFKRVICFRICVLPNLLGGEQINRQTLGKESFTSQKSVLTGRFRDAEKTILRQNKTDSFPHHYAHSVRF
jgi:hypothetical protein